MSCYLCTAEHIGQLASLLTVPWTDGAPPLVARPYAAVFAVLWEANITSVAEHYSEPACLVLPAPPAPLTTAQIIALQSAPRARDAANFAALVDTAARCYRYQSSDAANWDNSDARQWIEALREGAGWAVNADAAYWDAPFPGVVGEGTVEPALPAPTPAPTLEATPVNNHVPDDRSSTTRPVEYSGWYPTEAGNFRWYYWSAGRLMEGVTVRDPNLADRLIEEAEQAYISRAARAAKAAETETADAYCRWRDTTKAGG